MRKEVAIAAALVTAILGSVVFIAAYFITADRLVEGLAIAVSAAALSAAAVGWAFWILPEEQVVDRIDTWPSSPADRAAQSTEADEGLRQVTRPRFLLGLLGAALASFAAAMILPIRSLGLDPDRLLFHTSWRKGSRIVREDGSAVHVDDVNVDSTLTVFPENAREDSQSIATLVRVPDGTSGSVQGYMVYSRLCTHAGCPVALYRSDAHELICPCHQSAFAVLDNGSVVSGPADHALPRLPIEIGSDGILRATGDFPEPVGPGFWERG
ncbi:MAG: Rieske (2Fe-2S) protein [Candidatus Eremiobacteraeota bacterium]|nr:Rieske (2Fe-2S) protein [Candidatus Eremiobacteraeota bacterium]